MASSRSVLSFCLLAAILTPICGYRILMVCPMPSKSHYNLCRGVVDPLVDRGHEVVLISAYETKNSKFKDLAVTEIETVKKEIFLIANFEANQMNIVKIFKMMTNLQVEISKPLFSNVRVQELLSNKNETFDLVIFEHIINEMLLGLGVKFDCPIVALSPVNIMSSLATMTSTPLAIATIPSLMTGYTVKMNLWQRVTNFGVAIVEEIFGRFINKPIQRDLYNKYFPEESKAVPFDELEKRISAILVNTHPSIGLARPLLPNTIEIGGYHIKDPDPLPEDLKNILDTATEGVVYFSMGSNLKSSQMSPEIKSILLNAFGGLKQTVLWKYEEDLPEKSKNVIIRKWMPQTAILAHPNVKLFISHSGLLSCTEAVHFGVPLLAIPIFGDQHHNAKELQERGNGMMLSYKNITEKSFQWALKESLENPSYTEKAKLLSRLYHDRPMKPRDLLTFFVEHIIRTKGAEHLSPPKLNRCSLLLLDVMAVILVPLGIVCLTFSYVFWRCCCRKNKQQKSVNSDKKQKKQ